ncbi:hypothetical protein [Flavobacterium ginsengiterrae]|uniref:Uncharacterized protein n=1 Tax=Flavobacterium ginsengiterrae TaxID=871695 RepID=A0ABP7G917_9FLAO
MIKEWNRLASPVFLVSLVILLLNDLIFKTVFHNYITGKLSDFAGLLAFPFFWSVLFPKRVKEIHIAVVLFFIFWKSPYSEVFVNFFGLYRVIDFSDYIALVSVFISFQLFKKEIVIYKVQPIFIKFIFLLSCFSFMATTQGHEEVETFEDGFSSYLYLNNQTDKKIIAVIDFEFSENEITLFKEQQIKRLLDHYKKNISSEEGAERRLVYKPSDSLRIVQEVNDEWFIRQKYNSVHSILLDKEEEKYIALPLHLSDTLIGFPKSFKILFLDVNGNVLKSYNKKEFFKRRKSKNLNEFSRGQIFNLTFGKKKEPLHKSDCYGKWESDGKGDFNKIEINSNYFINDNNGEVYDCRYSNDSIFVYSLKKIHIGIIKKGTKDSLVISWNNERDLMYVRSKKPRVLAR